MTLKTADLTVYLSADYGCYVAIDGKTPEDSTTSGEGSTREDAIADYWYGRHNGKTATVLSPYDAGSDRWTLTDGTYVARFDSREEAVTYAEECQYITSPFVKEV